jgi:hypothetical protein
MHTTASRPRDDSPTFDLGTLGNTIAGLVGGDAAGAILTAVVGAIKNRSAA